VNKWPFVERRRFVRFDVQCKVIFRVKDNAPGQPSSDVVVAVSKNLSVEGICFKCEHKLKPGTILKLEVFLPNQEHPLNLEGKVIWHRVVFQEDKELFETGVNLFTLNKDDESKFVAYVCDKMTERLSKYLHL